MAQLSKEQIGIVFDEWRELFNRSRNQGKLNPKDRARFITLSKRLRDAGCFQREPSALRDTHSKS